MLLAFLGDGPFDTFEEVDTGLHAYCKNTAPAGTWQQPADAVEVLRELQEQFDFSWEATPIPGQNWNTLWESNFQPVEVGDFCVVRADFHPPMPGYRQELVINPKMAFGTGHHETTWQCIAAMQHLPLRQARVLDFGCGTGILAILAAKLGATEVEAVDIEEESYRNTLENAARNAVSGITVRCGTLDQVQGHDFHGILANINRPVILEGLPRLATMARPGAWLLLSGILQEDGALVRQAAAEAGFDFQQGTQRGNWLCLEFRRKAE